MSIPPETAAAAAPGAAATPRAKVITVPADVRRRILSGIKPPPETPEQIKAKADAAKAEEEKKKADAAAKKAEEDKAAGVVAPPVKKVAKVKPGPELPPPTAAAPVVNAADVEAAVRKIMPEPKAVVTPALSPEEQAELEFAAVAEAKDPTRYAGMKDKIATFYAEHAERCAAKAEELGGTNTADFREYLKSEEHSDWCKQRRPSYARGDRERIQREIIVDRTRAATREEMAPEMRRLERRTVEIEVGPQIAQAVSHAVKIILTDPAEKPEDKDPALEAFAKDPKAFAEEHPTDAAEIASVANGFAGAVKEVYRIDHNLVDLDTKNNAVHKWLNKFSVDQNAALREKHPSGLEQADGSILIDAKTFAERGLAKDPKYRTFNSDELAGMIAATGQAAVKARCGDIRQRVTKSIYAKPAAAGGNGAGPSGQPAKDKDDAASPTAASSAAPGARGKGAPPADEKKLGRKYA